MPFLIKTQVVLFYLFVRALQFYSSTFLIVQIDLTYEITK